MKELKNNLNIPIEILQLKITNTQKFVLAALYQLLKKDYETLVTIKKLAELSECSTKSTSTALDLFIEKHMIRKYNRKEETGYFIEIDSSYNNTTLNLRELIKLEKRRKLSRKFSGLHIEYNILHNKRLSPTDKLVLSYISNFAKKDKECFTKTCNVCEILGISVAEYKRSISKLKELKLIDSEITKTNNRITGKKIKADLVNIENLYIENINTIKQLEIDKATIKEAKKIEKLNSKETNIHNVEKIDNISKVESVNMSFINVGRISDELLETLNKEQLYKLYKENQEETERLKHFINKVDRLTYFNKESEQ